MTELELLEEGISSALTAVTAEPLLAMLYLTAVVVFIAVYLWPGPIKGVHK